ncbi:hypothetical protein [Longimicrobium sp.]|uniref:hypothetical protein n=1 Tax=Longimicrobium sp. TaxID=2029185 RepID=UPI002BD63110|nr:hypothetical protein [Longimicrobium sp.]HSU16145.1 hypothetical protein [Longimicrobium sp.]
MNLVVMLEANPDWIMLTNAITIKIRHQAPSILMLANPAVDLAAAGLTQNDTLFLIGHAGPDQAGDYTPETLAATLRARNLPGDHRFIVLPSSCEIAQEAPRGTFIARLVLALSKLEYNQVSVTGAVGLAISGWGVDQVVDPAQRAAYIVAEDRSIADNQPFIDAAAVLARGIDADSSSATIVAAATAIAMRVDYFYENLALRAHRHLLPPGTGTGTRTAAMASFRLNLSADANVEVRGAAAGPVARDARHRASLNRSPQEVRVRLRASGRVVPATYWAWERGAVLRIEAPGDISTAPAVLGGPCASVRFSNPDFELDVASITPA